MCNQNTLKKSDIMREFFRNLISDCLKSKAKYDVLTDNDTKMLAMISLFGFGPNHVPDVDTTSPSMTLLSRNPHKARFTL